MTDESPLQSPETARAKLHHAIRKEFTTALTKYFQQYPERLQDTVTMNAGIKLMLALLEGVLTRVDDYDIREKQS